MPQKRIRCPSHVAAASSFNDYTCTSQLVSVPVPDVLSFSQLAGQNTEVENVGKKRKKKKEYREHRAFVALDLPEIEGS